MPDGSMTILDPVKELTEVKSELKTVSAQVKSFAEEVLAKVRAGETLSADLTEKVDKALASQGDLARVDKGLADIIARMNEVEQKVVRSPGPDQASVYKTPGQMFVADEAVQKFMKDRSSRGRVRVDMAAITSITTQTAGATSNVLVVPERIPGIITPPERRMTVRDLITPGRTSQNAIQFVQESGFQNMAAVVSEGQTKPESDLEFELQTVNVSTIAHWMLASKQILDDAPMLESHIDGRLRYGLAFVEELELLAGNGTGNNLLGIMPQATAFVAQFAPLMQTIVDTIRLAILQAELALFPTTGIVLNPIDWARIELTKTTFGDYIFNQGPVNISGPMMWSRNVVSTPAMPADNFLTGAFKLGAQIFDREDANVELSTEDSDNFRRNLVTIRAEERLALAVYRPEAFITGSFFAEGTL